MPRPAARKPHPPKEADSGAGVVRSAKAIPRLGPAVTPAPAVAPREPLAAGKAQTCTGHCGHCDVHPCQLHASV